MPVDMLIKCSYKAYSIRKQLNKMVHKQFTRTVSIHATQKKKKKNRFAAHVRGVSKCNLNEESRLEGVILCGQCGNRQSKKKKIKRW